MGADVSPVAWPRGVERRQTRISDVKFKENRLPVCGKPPAGDRAHAVGPEAAAVERGGGDESAGAEAAQRGRGGGICDGDRGRRGAGDEGAGGGKFSGVFAGNARDPP